MKTQITIVLLLFFSSAVFSQIDEVKMVDKNLNYSGIYSIIVPGHGVLVTLGSLSVKSDTYIIKNNMTYYNEELKEVWNTKGEFNYTYTTKQIMEAYKGASLPYNETYSIDPMGEFIIFTDQINKNAAYHISLNNGRTTKIELEGTSDENVVEMKCASDKQNFYIVKIFSSDTEKDKNEVEIFTIDKKTMKVTKSSGKTPSNNGTKTGLTTTQRYWKIIGVDKKGLFLADNYAVSIKSGNQVMRRVICFDLSGELIKDTYLPMGDKMLYDGHIGNLYYNRFGEGRFYTFSMYKANKEKQLLYCEYDFSLNNLWKISKPTNVVPAKGDFVYNIIPNYNTGVDITLRQRETSQFYSLKIAEASNDKEFTFLDKNEMKGYASKEYRSLLLTVDEYLLIKDNPKIVSYLTKMKQQSPKTGIDVEIVRVNKDKLFVTVIPKPSALGKFKTMFFNAATFKG